MGIANGWAIDAFTEIARAHGDLDIGIPRSEAEGFLFERCLPKRDEASRCWLARSTEQEEPGHPWGRRLVG